MLIFVANSLMEVVHAKDSRYYRSIVSSADTKYKACDTIDQDDVYQVVAYAQKLSCSEAVLIYPFRSDNSYSYDWNGILTRTVAFDLQQSLDAAGEVFLRDLFGESFNDSLFAEQAVLREEK